MRILIDECLDQKLRNSLPGHDCQSARYAGFSGLKNGELLTRAEAAGFDLLLTVDHGFEYEQNLRKRRIAVVILRAKSVRLKDRCPSCQLASLSSSPSSRAKFSKLEAN